MKVVLKSRADGAGMAIFALCAIFGLGWGNDTSETGYRPRWSRVGQLWANLENRDSAVPGTAPPFLVGESEEECGGQGKACVRPCLRF